MIAKAQRWKMVEKRRVELEEFVFAPELKPRDVAVRAHCTAVSPGTECAVYLALDPDVFRAGAWCAYPWIPGYTGMGEVLAVGSAVTEFKTGDRVVGFLRHASHDVCSADESLALAHPGVQPQEAAYCRIINITSSALQALRIEPFETAGVWGLGMIGNLVAQGLRHGGYRVVGIDPIADRRALAQRCGVPLTLDPTVADFQDRVAALTGKREFDVTVDTTGHAATTIAMPEFTRRRGQMVLMTHWRSQPVLDASPLINGVFLKGITLVGALEVAIGAEPFQDWGARQRHKLTVIQQQIADGGLQVAPLISHVVKPSQCREAYEGLCSDKANWRGVVVDWR